jgi:hypothetical protein
MLSFGYNREGFTMETDLKSRLLSISNPFCFEDWYDHPQAYLQDRGVDASDIPELVALMQTWLSASTGELECDDAFDMDPDIDSPAYRQAYLPVTAWRCLAHLRASQAADFLWQCVFQDGAGIPEDDLCWEDCRHVIGLVGADFLPRLQAILSNRDLESRVVMKGAQSIASIAHFHPDRLQECIGVLQNAIAEVDKDAQTTAKHLLELTLAQIAPHTETGISVWTIPLVGGIADSYDEELFYYFSAICGEFYNACHDRLEANCQRVGWANWFLRTAFERFGESIAVMQLATVKSVLLDTFSRHVSTNLLNVDTLVTELRILFEYAADVYGLPNARSISEAMNEAMARQMKAKINSSNVSGIGNAIGSLARDMGYDLSDPEQLNEFTETFNQRMAGRQAASQQFMEPAGESFESSVPDPYVRYDERHKPQPRAPLGPSMTPEERKKFNRSRKKELGRKMRGDKRK